MINIKEIQWESQGSGSSLYYKASINGYYFLIIPNVDNRFYIHPTSNLIKIIGNQGVDEWGWFDNIDKCKLKAEKIILNSVLSLIDIRSYNIDNLIN
jgi:hypothetical protein